MSNIIIPDLSVARGRDTHNVLFRCTFMRMSLPGDSMGPVFSCIQVIIF